ncbi:PapD-like protein, partial [Gigaspora rosea]
MICNNFEIFVLIIGPFTQPVKEILIIHNPNHEPVSFRIKTTAPKQYAVRPNMGRIEPNQKVEIQFILCPMKEDPSLDFKCKDKFKIQSIGITPEHKTLSLQELWAITSEDLIKEKKIQCVYLPPVANNLLPTLASPEPLRDDDDDDPAKLRRHLLEAKDEIARLNNMIENYKQELNTTQMKQRKNEEAVASFEKLSNYCLELLNDK